MARHSALRNRLEYWCYRAAALPFRALPRRIALAIGAVLGRLAGLCLRSKRAMALENLRQGMPELGERERAATVAEMFAQLGRSGLELLRLEQFHAVADLSELFDFHGLEHLRAAHAEGKGVLLLTAHLGFWEAGTVFLPRLGFPTAFVAKRMKNPLLDAQLTRIRNSSGGTVLDARSGARRILRALNAGQVVTIMPDQRITPQKAVPARFFGRLAWTTPATAQLAMKTGAPVVPGFVVRLPDQRYRVTIAPPLHFTPSDDPADLLRHTQTLNDLIEAAVRAHPAQWFWLHNRWRP